MKTLNLHPFIWMTFCGVVGACVTTSGEEPASEEQINALAEQAISTDDVTAEDRLEQQATDSSDQAALWQGTLQSYLNGKCLDILWADTSNRALVGMYTCVPGTSNQQWYWSGDQLRSKLNHKCLDVLWADPNNRAPVGMYTCVPGTPNQQWYWYGNQLRSKLNHKCLDVLWADTSNRAAVGMYSCVPGTLNQQWY